MLATSSAVTPTTTASAPTAASAEVARLPARAQAAAPSPAAVVMPAPSGLTPLPGAAALVTRVENFYASASPFECDLDVERIDKAHNVRTAGRVHVDFDHPGRFHIALPGGQRMVIDQQVASFVDPSSQGLVQTPVAADYCPPSLGYAAGPGGLARTFTFQAYAGAAMNAPGLDILVGTPKTASPAVTKAIYSVDAMSHVRRTLVVSSTGDRHRYDLVGCTMKTKPAASLFAIGPQPPGTAQSAPGRPLIPFPP
jgi:hypothetical protein